MKQYRAALLGCGRIGSEFADDPRVKGVYTHAGAYAACPRTELAAVCDPDPARLARCGDRWCVGARYQDPERLLAEQAPELVSVCTPDSTHYALIRAAITAPGVRAVLAEKPLALELGQAEELVRLAVERGVTLAVNYSRRYAKSHVRLREALRGSIGETQTVGGYYTKGLLHNGTHWIDLARFLVGEITEVWGCASKAGGEEDPTLDAFFRFESGATGYLHGCDAGAFSLFEMDLIGTRGRARITDAGATFEFSQAADSTRYSGYRELTPARKEPAGLGDTLLHAVEDLVTALEEGRAPRCSGEDGVAALRIALAVRDAASRGRGVPVSR